MPASTTPRRSLTLVVRWLLASGLFAAGGSKMLSHAELGQSGRSAYLVVAVGEILIASLVLCRWRPLATLWSLCTCILAGIVWSLLARDPSCACFGTLWSPTVGVRLVLLSVAGLLVLLLLRQEMDNAAIANNPGAALPL